MVLMFPCCCEIARAPAQGRFVEKPVCSFSDSNLTEFYHSLACAFVTRTQREVARLDSFATVILKAQGVKKRVQLSRVIHYHAR